MSYLHDVVYQETCYCSLCDAYFPDLEARATHVSLSPNHPECTKCKTRYANGNALRNHYVISSRHNYCSACRCEFRTPAGFRAHVEFASIHRDDEQDEDESHDDIDDSYEGWEDDVGARLWPEENEHEEPEVDDDNVIDPEDEYWDDEDEPFPGQEEYHAWAPVPQEVAQTAREAITAMASSQNAASAPATDDQAQTSPAHICANAGNSGDPVSADSVAALVGCPLCLEPAVQPQVTRCGHVFCGPCIGHALEIKKCCPVCRVPAVSKQLRRIFFTPVSSTTDV